MSRYLLSIVMVAVLAIAACAPDSPAPTGTVIINARVIDGSGGDSRNVSVRLIDDRITEVGTFDPTENDDVVDAGGLVLAPGFIDTHSHHGHQLDEHPDALAAVSQGLTTIAAGQDGSHLYPLADFFSRLEAEPVAINVASYAGHGTIRGEVMGDDYMREATAEEIEAMATILRSEMDAGALGLSTGLEYDPGSFSSPQEVVELAKVAAEYDGHYISHIRSEDQYFWEAVDEVINIGREAQIPVRVTHAKLAMTRWWGQNERFIDVLDQARESGVDITVDVYPYRMWNTGFAWLITLFPDRDLDRRDGAEYVLNDMLSPEGILLPEYFPNTDYNGMTIAEISLLRETDPETTLMDLLKAEQDFDGPESPMLGFAMDEPDIEVIMAWPHTVIGSDGELDGSHPRGYGTFTRYLGRYIRERQVLSLEEGVRRITALPAEQVGIIDRGLIREGYYADLVLFDPDTIIDRSTAEAPHVPSVGIDRVWVNGELVYDNGSVTGARPGRPIRRSDAIM
jgi:N-acyl-D-amino-acid deacylase